MSERQEPRPSSLLFSSSPELPPAGSRGEEGELIAPGGQDEPRPPHRVLVEAGAEDELLLLAEIARDPVHLAPAGGDRKETDRRGGGGIERLGEAAHRDLEVGI